VCIWLVWRNLNGIKNFYYGTIFAQHFACSFGEVGSGSVLCLIKVGTFFFPLLLSFYLPHSIRGLGYLMGLEQFERVLLSCMSSG
jgi:hypothetical protein